MENPLDIPLTRKRLTVLPAIGAGAVKPFTESFLARYVGDGNALSCVVKVALAGAVSQVFPRGKYMDFAADTITIALGTDGGEDGALTLMRTFGFLNVGQTSSGSSEEQTNPSIVM